MPVWLVKFKNHAARLDIEIEADDPISAVLDAVNRHGAGAGAGDLEMKEGQIYTSDFFVRRMPNGGAWFSVRWRWS